MNGEDAAMGLTQKQRQLMQVLQELVDETGVCPSYRELAREMDLASRSSVHRLVVHLEARGYLRVSPGRQRSLTILRRVPMPDRGSDEALAACQKVATVFGAAPDEVIEGAFGSDVLGAVQACRSAVLSSIGDACRSVALKGERP